MMREELMKALGKPPKEKDPMKSDAKMKVLGDLQNAASKAMGDDMAEGMSQVTVAAKDKEGLKSGLQKAEELMGESKKEIKDETAPIEPSESDDIENEMLCDVMEDESKIDEAIKMLLKKKQELKSDHSDMLP